MDNLKLININPNTAVLLVNHTSNPCYDDFNRRFGITNNLSFSSSQRENPNKITFNERRLNVVEGLGSNSNIFDERELD